MKIIIVLISLFFSFPAFMGAETSVITADWGEIQSGEFKIANNVWGKGDIKDYKQSVWIGNEIIPGANSPDFNWKWEWPDNGGGVKAYPAVIFGRKPWDASSTTARLPKPAIKCGFEIEYEYLTEAHGIYNCAFDIFLTTAEISGPAGIRAELMIWVGNSGMQPPPGSSVTVVSIDGKEFDLAVVRDFGSGEVRSTYIAFIAKRSHNKGRVKLRKFLKYIADRRIIENDLYISSIEFGNEIINGSGATKIVKYGIK